MKRQIVYTSLLFLIDRVLKSIAFAYPNTLFVFKGIIGWEFFANRGITFGIPIPMIFLQISTPVFILFLYLFIKNREKRYIFPFFLVFLGALSNYIDRVIFGITIDYLRIFNGVANIADFMIFIGIVYIIQYSNKESR